MAERICECSHHSCFHRPIPTGVRAMFADPPSKACNVKDCACLRFTDKNKEE